MSSTTLTRERFDPSRRRRPRIGDLGLRWLSLAAALGAIALVIVLAYEVGHGASDAISAFGLSFFTDTQWNAVTNVYGARYLILGTVITSFVALVIAVPLAIAIGLFLSELAPRRLRAPVGILVELLAAIPSVVLGLWGILVLGPFLAEHVEPKLHAWFGWLPWLFDGSPSNVGLLPACLILAIMIVPIIASISRELLISVPPDLKQGAMALGATRWEMVRGVALPQVSAGLVAAVMLGLARALGEAVAVSMVIGNSAVFPTGLFGPSNTMAAQIVNQYAGAATKLQTSALWYLALILLAISLLTNLSAQLTVRRIRRRQGGVA